MQRIPLTPEGHKKLESELENLIKVERPGNIKAIAEARAHGDLSENAEYHAAKERQGFIEGRIQELKIKLSQAEIIDPSRMDHDRVTFGASVTLMDLDTDKEITYMLVGPEEADVKAGKISTSSPVGRALIGKEEGDEVRIQAPGRTVEYEILDITFK
ncbi:MAG: transcription elongation factor GreA [Thermodesulfovibrionales bacterium]|nr:transcription elongation factor GreA [Thermodesulfovibrionales bacterium]